MSRDQVEALVLRTFPLADQDKLAVFLTQERGLLRGVAKGARKFGNRFGSALEPLSHVTVFFYEKEGSDLVTVSGCDLRESFFDVASDLRAHFALAYIAELVEEFVPVRSRDSLAFRLFRAILQALRDGVEPGILTRYFEAWLLRLNGIMPDIRRCRRCRTAIAETSPGWLSPRRDGIYCDSCAPSRKEAIGDSLGKFVAWVQENPPSACASAPFPAEDIASFGKALQALLVYHLEREPKCLRFLTG
ncbi:MAG: DNA repair protein RecO [Candidatus Aminicenantes bacterium]|nr:DNA repair protein RecO [Candidatus Aminicenantes bacterium]